MSVTITIDDAGAKRKFTAVMGLLQKPEGLLAVLGRDLANQLKAWFIRNDQTYPSALGQLGGRRQHFWRDVSKSVQAPVVNVGNREVSVAITDPRIGQKVFGGTITPKRAKMLAIPIIAEAYARAPRVFEQETGLKLFPLRQRGNLLLAARNQAGGLTVAYALRSSVTQRPDPNALPSNDSVLRGLVARADAYLARKLSSQNP